MPAFDLPRRRGASGGKVSNGRRGLAGEDVEKDLEAVAVELRALGDLSIEREVARERAGGDASSRGGEVGTSGSDPGEGPAMRALESCEPPLLTEDYLYDDLGGTTSPDARKVPSATSASLAYRAAVAVVVTRVPYGEPAVALLVERVRAAKAGNPLAPVTVVVPSNYAAVATRRELARRGGVVGASFLTLYRLAERIGGPALAAAGRRPVSASVVLQAVRAILTEAPGILAPVADHQATALALAAAQRELAGVSPEALDAVAAQSSRAADVFRIVRAVTDRLRRFWHDEHDLVVTATDVLRTTNAVELGPVIHYLPQRVPPGGADLLDAVAARGSLTALIGATGVDAADRPVLAALQRAGIAVPPPSGIERPRAIRVVSTSDPDDEVRAAVRMVVEGARSRRPRGQGRPLSSPARRVRPRRGRGRRGTSGSGSAALPESNRGREQRGRRDVG